VPFWISAAIPQEWELAVLGCQVSQLVLLNWPLAFSPPILAQIYTGPKKEREEFWSRVNWPWQSPALLQGDGATLIGSSSPTTSSVWTSQSRSASVVSSEAVQMWGKIVSSCSANAPSQLGEA
jgi:hypothetical protein